MVGSSYKRYVGIANNKQQLLNVNRCFGSSFKFVDDNRCNMKITIIEQQLLEDGR
jgi:hypothetical protein